MAEIYVLSEKRFAGAKNLPVIVFDYFEEKEIDLSPYDALIFTSKNGVIAIDRINACWRAKEIYSIGSGTSKAVRELGGNVVYEAKSSYGDRFAEEISEHLAGKKVLFLRPETVTSNLNKILKNAGVDLHEEIVYRTRCNDCDKLIPPPEGAYIIFSSPSTIECFLRCFSWRPDWHAIVIGEKTASYMPKEIPFVMSEKQTISNCIALAQRMISASNPSI